MGERQIMNLLRGFRQKRQFNQRVKDLNQFLQGKLDAYNGAGEGSLLTEKITENGKKAVVLHVIITQKPFETLKATVVMAANGSFSVKVTDDTYRLYRLWFDRKGDNSPTHMLTTTAFAELEQCSDDEWEKGTDGKFFRN